MDCLVQMIVVVFANGPSTTVSGGDWHVELTHTADTDFLFVILLLASELDLFYQNPGCLPTSWIISAPKLNLNLKTQTETELLEMHRLTE